MKLPRQPFGFTLIELLVVMVIIAVLAGLIFGVSKGAADVRKNTQRIADLKQIGTALIAFAAENNDQFPVAGAIVEYGRVDPITQLPSWQEQLDPMLGKNRKIFAGPEPIKLGDNLYQSAYFLGSRGANNNQNPEFASVRSLKISHPTKYVLAGQDALNMFTANDADKDNYGQEPAFGGRTTPGAKVPLLFADGHARVFDRYEPSMMEFSYEGP